MQPTFPANEADIAAFVTSLSKPRLSKYLVRAGGHTAYALRLYHWNSRLSQSLYINLQTWEITLRNRLNQFLCWKYNANWPYSQVALRNLSGKDAKRLAEAIERQANAHGVDRPTVDQIVSDLSAGFWVSQFGRGYDVPYRWRDNLKWRVFTNDHALLREDAAKICDRLLDLRNRVAHHEPILTLPLPTLKANLDLITGAICPVAAAFMASTCSFDAVWNDQPEANSAQEADTTQGTSVVNDPEGAAPTKRPVLKLRP